MKKLTKTLTVPTLITCTLGWAWFASQAIEESNKVGTSESSNVIKRMEDIKKNSIVYQVESFHKEYERLKEEERKRLEELERQRLEKLEKERQAKLEQERLARIEKERQLAEAKRIEEAKKAEQVRLANEKKKQSVQNVNSNKKVDDSSQSGWVTFNGSYYGANCYQCSGITAVGINVNNTIYYNGYRIIALDPNTIPLWSIVEVKTPNESFKAVVGDTGGRIKGFNADILVDSEARAAQLGRHNIQIRVIGSLK
ncbi:3D domain-containing protein [Lysinibacillus sp. M3]|uniref:3D domain-containing protein n=1 Tax=Lysinibacillus zambalensis TaxID=3160866 RepID=A0ABV1MU20_9BACI